MSLISIGCLANAETIHGKREITYFSVGDSVRCIDTTRVMHCSKKEVDRILSNGGVINGDGVIRRVLFEVGKPPVINNCGKVVYNPKINKSFYVNCGSVK